MTILYVKIWPEDPTRPRIQFDQAILTFQRLNKASKTRHFLSKNHLIKANTDQNHDLPQPNQPLNRLCMPWRRAPRHATVKPLRRLKLLGDRHPSRPRITVNRGVPGGARGAW